MLKDKSRYSLYATYSIVYLSKTIFIFVVSIFSIALVRVNKKEPGSDEYTFSGYFEMLKAEDFTCLKLALVISVFADYVIFNADNISLGNRIENPKATKAEPIKYTELLSTAKKGNSVKGLPFYSNLICHKEF